MTLNVFNKNCFNSKLTLLVYHLINPLDVVQFREKFAFRKKSFSTQHFFATPNCTLWLLFAG